MLSGLYILIASGLTLVLGVIHIINFAHGAFIMLGAYAIYFLSARWGVPYLFAFVISVFTLGALGMVVEKFLYHRFWGKVLPCLVVAVGLTQVIQQGALVAFGIESKYMDSIFRGTITFLGARFSVERLMVVVIASVLVLGLLIFLKTTKIGMAMRAAAQDTDAAILQGVSISKAAQLAMFIGCGMAAAAGMIIAPIFRADAYMGELLLTKAFMIIIIGGMGSLPGAIMGGLLVGFIDSVGQTLIGYPSQILLFILVIVVLLVKPTGLFSGIVFTIEA
jgi:branched-chain amino acid transport system permease protein